jgi:hypothetical protein
LKHELPVPGAARPDNTYPRSVVFDAGRTIHFNFKVNDSARSPDLMLSMDRRAAEGLSHSFHPNWIRQWPNELEFGSER